MGKNTLSLFCFQFCYILVVGFLRDKFLGLVSNSKQKSSGTLSLFLYMV